MRLRLLSLLLAACASSPSAPVPDLPALAIGYEAADALVVPPGASAAAGSRQALVSVRRAQRPTSVAPLDSFVATVIADEGAPFRGASSVLNGWFLLPAPPSLEPEPTPESERQQAALLIPDLTTRVTFGDATLPELLLRRDGDRLTLGLRAAPTGRQLAIVPGLEFDSRERIILLAAPATDRHGLLITIELTGEADPASIERARAESTATASEDATAERPTWTARLARGAVGEEPRRRALLALAYGLDLARCVDLMLCADVRPLIAIANGLPDGPAEPHATELAIWRAVLPFLQRGEAGLALTACARRHLGVLALDPTSFEFVLQTASSRDEFEAAIVERNREALDARSADQRCAAVDWLRARGHEVPAYDPFASRAERRAILEKLEGERR